jgi:acylphosphatase
MAMTEEPIRRRVQVSGRVQGVAFRASARAEARARGVSGWVRNRADGSVEAVFEGAPQAVAALVAWCREGPRAARVERVEVQDEAPEALAGFEVR